MNRAKSWILALLMAILGFANAAAENADSIAGECLSHSRWFELQDVYRRDSLQLSPYVRHLSEAMLHYAFGRSGEAVESIRRLLRTHQKEMDFSTVYSMVSLLAANQNRQGDNKGAAATLNGFIRQIEGKIDSTAVNSLKTKVAIYEGLAAYELFKGNNSEQYSAPFRMREVGDSGQSLMYLPGMLNGKSAEYVFDTGASYCVATPEAAVKYRMRILGAGVAAQGMRNIGGQMAIADSLRIGTLTLRNVPFVILDLKQGNELAATAMANLSLIIGQPLLTTFGKYTIDFDQNSVDFYRHTPKTGERSNLYMHSTAMTEMEKDGQRFAITLDTGCTLSYLGTEFYRMFAADVAREGKWDVVASAGAGGVVYSSVFRMPKITVSVGGTAMDMERINVYSITQEAGEPNFGRLGIDYLRKFRQMTVDNTNMILTLQR